MRRIDAAVAAVVCGLAWLPTAAWPGSAPWQSETNLNIHNDAPQTDGYEAGIDDSQSPPPGMQQRPSAPSRPTAPRTPTAAAPAPSNPALPRVLIFSPPHKSCIDAENKDPASPLAMKTDCTAPSQQWISDKGRLMTAWANASVSQCIRRVSQKSDLVQLTSCKVSEPPPADQMWVMRGAQIVGVDARCLQSDGRGLRVGPCDPQNATQMWVASPIP